MSSDPFSIKQSLINLIDKHLGANSTDVYEAGFLGYLTQAQTLLTSDVIFNNAMSWREAFTHLLQLPTSLQNHANMFDYQLSSASPCEGTITIYVPYVDDSYSYQFTLKNGTKCDGSIPYLIKNSYIIDMSQSTYKVQKKDALTGVISDIDSNLIIESGDRYLKFQAEVWQIRIYRLDEKFTDVNYKEFYDISISGVEDQFYDINVGVYINDDNFAEQRLVKFNRVESIYTCTSTDRCYTFKYYGNGRGLIRFGNGVFGYQPKENTNASILIYSTMGLDGIAYPDEITLNTKLIDFNTGAELQIYGKNLLKIENGLSEENIEVAKKNIIAQTSSARRLVTHNDYNGFSGITGIKNIELYPMLLKRDTNANEIDLFSVIYDNNGTPIPTNNLNLIIDKDRKILSKELIYKVAVISGENGIELAPNTLKYFNKSKIYDADNPEIIGAEYVNSNYDNYNEELSEYDGKVYYLYSDGSKGNPITDFEIIEFVCPYNINIESVGANKIGRFEYVPYSLDDTPALEDQIDYVNIDIVLKSALYQYVPYEAFAYSNIRPTHINCINNLLISENLNPDLLSTKVVIKSAESDEVSYEYPCSNKSISLENNQMQVSCLIPIDQIFNGPIEYEFIIYYSSKFFNSYKKTLTFKDRYDYSLVTEYINVEQSFVYNPDDVTSTQQTASSIDKVNISVVGTNISWDDWSAEESDEYEISEGYKLIVEINKLTEVDLNKVKITVAFEKSEDEYESSSKIVDENNISAKYIFKIPYNNKYILDGITNYKINVYYRFRDDYGNESSEYTKFSTYTGFAVFRRKLSELMYCNIEKIDRYNTTSNYMIYKIPVVEKEYYENNKETFENEVLSKLTSLDINLINYRMLSDRINFKFAKTIGVTENLKYNDQVEDIDSSLKYNNWTCELPPKIKLSVLIDKKSERTKQDIILDCKQVILSFLQLKADFNVQITRSEISRYLHDTVSEVISCEVIEPSRDIIYFFSENDLPRDKDTVLSYTPEFLYIDVDKIKIEVKMTPV